MKESTTNELLEQIALRLVSLGEISSSYKYQNHPRQGYNSQVLTLSSEDKELIVHLAKPFEHYYADKVWEKLVAISNFLRQETKLPIARIIFAEPLQEFIVSAQERLPGDIAGTATIVDNRVEYTWFQNKIVLMPQIQKMVAEIHNISVSGFGLPMENSGKFIGTSNTWQEFLLHRTKLWLGALDPGGSARVLEADLHKEIVTYAERWCNEAPTTEGSLIHGDLGNPSNVLGEHERVTGIIDWEFALIADPAWEFCDEGWVETVQETGLETYFQVRNISQGNKRRAFLRRIMLYRPLQCLMWLYVHRNDAAPDIFDTCVALLRKDLAEAKREW